MRRCTAAAQACDGELCLPAGDTLVVVSHVDDGVWGHDDDSSAGIACPVKVGDRLVTINSDSVATMSPAQVRVRCCIAAVSACVATPNRRWLWRWCTYWCGRCMACCSHGEPPLPL